MHLSAVSKFIRNERRESYSRKRTLKDYGSRNQLCVMWQKANFKPLPHPHDPCVGWFQVLGAGRSRYLWSVWTDDPCQERYRQLGPGRTRDEKQINLRERRTAEDWWRVALMEIWTQCLKTKTELNSEKNKSLYTYGDTFVFSRQTHTYICMCVYICVYRNTKQCILKF